MSRLNLHNPTIAEQAENVMDERRDECRVFINNKAAADARIDDTLRRRFIPDLAAAKRVEEAICGVKLCRRCTRIANITGLCDGCERAEEIADDCKWEARCR